MKKSFDVIIIGAGPAGSTTAIALQNSGLKIALIDKNTFPRDKICGDALSPDVVSQLHKLPLDTGSLFDSFKAKTWCKAVRFVAPNHGTADVKLVDEHLTGFVSERMQFDHFMYQQAIKNPDVTDFTHTSIERIDVGVDEHAIVLNNGNTLVARMILGADGAQSLVKRTFQPEPIDKNHHCAGLRVYYEGVTGFSEDQAVELHFYKELLPGYFWVFPLPDGKANVGVGMLSAYVSKNKINLKEKLQEIITHHPNVSHRFKNARQLESIKGFPLPLGSKKRQISGDGYLLLGDAASLINPLSGEGIANAIRSGRVASEHIQQAFKKQRFDAAFNAAYDKEIYRRLWGELRMNYWLQIAMRTPGRCNFIIEKAINSRIVQEAVMSGFNSGQFLKRMTSVRKKKSIS